MVAPTRQHTAKDVDKEDTIIIALPSRVGKD